MLKSLITSETKIKLLMKFFINPNTSGYLRQLAKEFGESTNSIRIELNKLTESKILNSRTSGRNKLYYANTKHPLFQDIRQIILKSTGIDKVLSNIINNIGNVKLAFIRGDYATGTDSGLIDLVIIGEGINIQELERVKQKTETLIERKIALLVLTIEEFNRLKDILLEKQYLILLGSFQ